MNSEKENENFINIEEKIADDQVEEGEDYWKKESWKTMAQVDLPFLPTPMSVIERIFELNIIKSLRKTQNDIKLIDLGAGDGRVIVFAADKHKINSVGLEINVNFIKTAQSEIVKRNIKDICNMVEADFYNYDVSSFDIIFCFILPTNQKYFKHVLQEVKKNAIVISIRWPLNHENLHRLIEKLEILPSDSDASQFNVYLYKKL